MLNLHLALPALSQLGRAAVLGTQRVFGQQTRGLLWSVEREQGHVYKDVGEIINDKAIHDAMESTKNLAKDPAAVQAVLDAAKERSFLTNYTPGAHAYPRSSCSCINSRNLGTDVKPWLCRHLPRRQVGICAGADAEGVRHAPEHRRGEQGPHAESLRHSLRH